MAAVKVYHYDAFSSIPNKGNPAGVVLEGGSLTEEQMLQVAAAVGFNETAFPLPSEQADLRIRFFTPGHEINLCGHATMATIYALKTRGLLGNRETLTIETKAGILSIQLDEREGGLLITMQQAASQFEPFNGSLEQLAYAMGIAQDDISAELPVVYGSTGTWTLIIPVKGLAVCERMKPRNELFPSVLEEMPRASLHPFCLETYDPAAHMHARHFSSPFSGTVEDPVTGTASGVMGAYYAKYIKHGQDPVLHLRVEQGQEIGRDGRVDVTVTNDTGIAIRGTAVYVNEFEVSI
ncbi:PhzF family phenazine biosynthesis protein [Paenibacillus sp. MMS18-CY102]|uniref:PhzF family phenazine biosynthesis protein n=1 Tax=Paenibacillus sp. MMS18-CY102 TaxID=2682849 RepID=UPI0013666568|nr:PhzF family phenazine biosynthesis isomerase [Paenibacillus sp. MMS18-CY102]MWC29751.1 PhzF family phenazine biosynthesis isomerase [Paenibacillus sp. MMS18-CY102]